MSHFTRIQTRLRDIAIVKEALKDLKYAVRENDAVRGYSRWERVSADVVVEAEDGRDIGFRQDGDQVELVADFWNRRLDQEAFLQRITQRYAYRMVIQKAGEQGFQVVKEEQQQDGSIRVVVQRW
mgnify:CR=1 FL=1